MFVHYRLIRGACRDGRTCVSTNLRRHRLFIDPAYATFHLLIASLLIANDVEYDAHDVRVASLIRQTFQKAVRFLGFRFVIATAAAVAVLTWNVRHTTW